MIELPVQQNTAAWHAERAGIPTASEAHRLITPKGNSAGKDTHKKYMYDLLFQRVSQVPIVPFKSFWMERGHEEEKNAIQFYEFTREVETEPVGFILNDERTAGCSPDRRLVGVNAGLEIKSPKGATHLQYFCESGKAEGDHYCQVQYQCWITGWDYVDLYSYHDEIPAALVKTPRDEAFIKTLDEIAKEFIQKLEAAFQGLVADGVAVADWRKTVAAPKPKINQDSMIQAVREAMIEAQR